MHSLDSVTATKFVTELLYHVTCFECCKYYLVPHTAICGHTLCHYCWYGRQSCAYCMESVNRKSLKLNVPIQNLTEHIRLLVGRFEKLFNIKLNELAFDNLDIINKDSKSEQTKNVKHWSQQSTQKFQSLKLSPSKIHMHEETKKTIDSARNPQAQDDWDKIEVLSDTEDLSTSHIDNVIGPMDVEPYYVHDYTTENSLRSSGKKDTKNKHQCFELFDVSKQSSNNSTDEIEIKNINAKQSCNNAIKMRKEFNKLNKKKNNKLNVSNEMCKETHSHIELTPRAHSIVNKPHATSLPLVADQLANVIDDSSKKKSDSLKETRVKLKQSLKRNRDIDNEEETPSKKAKTNSENVFSLYEKDNIQNAISKRNRQIPSPETHKDIYNLLTPDMCLESSHESGMHINDVEMISETLCTSAKANEDDSDKSVMKETPQKKTITLVYGRPFSKHKTRSHLIKRQDNSNDKHDFQRSDKKLQENIKLQNISGVEENTNEKQMNVIKSDKKNTLETSSTINKFVNLIKHKSTPHKYTRNSLNFSNDVTECNKDQTICSVSLAARTTQEDEFISEAFEKTPKSQINMALAVKNTKAIQNVKLCVAASCLTSDELNDVKRLCMKRNWMWVDKYTKDLSHLIVGVDDENKSQRTVKYMSALAAGKWIVSYAWVRKCLQTNEIVDEEPYEVLDDTGEPGPRRSRVAIQKLFRGITFYCMPPFALLDVDTLKEMLEAAGGRVVDELNRVRARPGAPALVLGESVNAQENPFICLAVERSIVPVNYEWVLNCLGSYTLYSIHEQLLCPAALLPVATAGWPATLIALE